MRRNKLEFKKICRDKFSFLYSQYNFRQESIVTSKDDITYSIKNNTTGIIIVEETVDLYPTLFLCRLKNGELANNPSHVLDDSIIHNFELNELLLLRAPAKIFPSKKTKEFTDNIISNILIHGKTPKKKQYPENLSINDILEKYALNVKNFSQDILQGDFTIFFQLEMLVKKRAKEFAIKSWGKAGARKLGWII